MKKCLLLIACAAALSAQSSNFQPPGLVSAPASYSSALWQPEGQSGPIVGRPFSGTEIRHTTQTLADGTHVDHEDTSLFYRDAFGRMRNESSKRVQLYDPVASVSYTLELKDKVYEKTVLPSDKTYSLAVVGSLIVSGTNDNRPTADPRKEDLPAQMVNGVYCRGSRVTSVIPAGTFGNDRDVKVMNERWYSDDLKTLVRSVNSDPRFGVSTYELTNIVQGAPAPSLFMVPTDFTNAQSHGSR